MNINHEQTGVPEKQPQKKRSGKTKHSAIQLVRHIIQLAAFILLPGLFISTYSAIGDVYTALIGGTFSVSALAPQLWLLAAILPITILAGRFFCGFLCAFGTMGDFLWFLSRKVVPHRKPISKKVDGILKLLKYIILVGSVVFLWTLSLSLSNTMDPWTIFGMYASVTGWPSPGYLLSIGGALLLLIIIGSLFVERFFCRYLCPLGAVFAVLSRLRLFRIKKPRKNCGNCKLCTVKCAMGIPLDETDSVQSGECINCFQCVTVCPRNNAKTTPKPPVAAALSVAAISGLYYAGNLRTTDAAASAAPVSISASAVQGQYTDGVYEGSAAGYKGNTTVQVTVQNGNISDIEVLSTGDDEQFFSKAKNTVISSIIAQQSASVDTVSGATFSSNGIIGAVQNALANAGGTTEEQTSDETSASEQTATGNDQEDHAAEAADTGTSSVQNLQDGIYTGTGTGFRGDTTVQVTVSGGKISDISIESYQDDEPYFNRAKDGVISSILSEQTVDVDAVSGATFSSNGIMDAVADALNLSFDRSADSGTENPQNGAHNGLEHKHP